MSEAISAIEPYLTNSDSYVRYLAGRNLLLIGDNNGAIALLGLVQTKIPIMGIEGEGDIRIRAASILGQFRQTDAAQAIFALYHQSNEGQLIYALELLEADQAKTIVEAKGYYPEVPSMVHYGKVKANTFLPQITLAFQNSSKPDVKAAAAWALATMTGDQNAINYLVQQSKIALSDSDQSRYVDEKTIVFYLGTIQTPEAKQALEAALDGKSRDPSVVRIAAVNLVFNQGGSSKVNQLVAGE